MSISYELEMSTSQTPREVLESVNSSSDIKRNISQRADGAFYFTSDGFIASAHTIDEEYSDIPQLGLTNLAVIIYFKLINISKMDGMADAEIIRSALSWFLESRKDGVLTFNGETVIVYQKSEHVTINSSTDIWKPDFLEFVKSEYSFASIPTL